MMGLLSAISRKMITVLSVVVEVNTMKAFVKYFCG